MQHDYWDYRLLDNKIIKLCNITKLTCAPTPKTGKLPVVNRLKFETTLDYLTFDDPKSVTPFILKANRFLLIASEPIE